MALERVVDLSQVLELGNRDKAGLSPGGVEDRGSVALGQDESVAGRVSRLLDSVSHGVEEENTENVGHGAA